RDGNAGTQILGELEDLLVAQLLDVGLIDLVGVDTAQEFAQIARLLVGTHRLVEQIADLPAEARRGPTEMGLEDLTDIHAARHAERIEHDVDMRAVLEIRHVLDRHDARDDALVAVTAGHLVAGLKLALHRDEHLDHLHHAGRQLVSALQLLDLALEVVLQDLDGVVHLLLERLDLRHTLVVLDRDAAQLMVFDFLQSLFIELRAGLHVTAARNFLAREQVAQARIEAAIEDRLLVFAVLGETLDFRTLDRQGALVLIDAAA